MLKSLKILIVVTPWVRLQKGPRPGGGQSGIIEKCKLLCTESRLGSERAIVGG